MATPNPGVVFCSACGRQNIAESRFCNACGASLQRIEPPTLTPAASLPPGVPITPAKPARGRGCLKWTLGLIGVIVLLSLCGTLTSSDNTTEQTSNRPTATPRVTAVPAAVEAPTATSTATQAPTTQPTVRPTDITGIVAKAGNVRNVPGTDGSEVIGQLTAGDTVILRGRRNVGADVWYQVTMPDGVWGWASSILLTVEEAASAALPEPTPEPTPTARTVGSLEEAEALRFCRETLKKALTSPATADFPFWGPDSSIPFGDRVTIVDHVDSQNSFGALVRTNYRCIVRFDWANDQKVIEELIQLD